MSRTDFTAPVAPRPSCWTESTSVIIARGHLLYQDLEHVVLFRGLLHNMYHLLHEAQCSPNDFACFSMDINGCRIVPFKQSLQDLAGMLSNWDATGLLG